MTKTRRMKDSVLEICGGEEVILSIAEELADGTMTIRLAGKIQNEVAHEFEDEVMAVLSVCRQIVLDMGRVTYIASMALSTLLSIQQMIDEIEGASMVLKHITPQVMEILKESGFSEILMIETE